MDHPALPVHLRYCCNIDWRWLSTCRFSASAAPSKRHRMGRRLRREKISPFAYIIINAPEMVDLRSSNNIPPEHPYTVYLKQLLGFCSLDSFRNMFVMLACAWKKPVYSWSCLDQPALCRRDEEKALKRETSVLCKWCLNNHRRRTTTAGSIGRTAPLYLRS